MYSWSITFTFTKPSKLKFILLQMSSFWTCLNQLSSGCTQPHPLLTIHDLTHLTLGSLAKRPDSLATVLLHPYKQFNWGCPSAWQHMWCPGRCWLSVSILHAQGNNKGDTLYQSGQIREVVWLMEGTTKKVANIWHTFQMINLIDESTYH